MDLVTLESCHSTWIFDADRRRYRRVLNGGDGTLWDVATAWRPYRDLRVDQEGESFLVVLNADGTRLIRSWRHTGDCEQCGGQATAEPPLAEVRALACA
jgi:hypothetical protein